MTENQDVPANPEHPEQDAHGDASSDAVVAPTAPAADPFESPADAEAQSETVVAAQPSSDLPVASDIEVRTPSPAQELQEEAREVNPQVASLRSMFPDFDDGLLASVLQSVGGNQERAVDTLLGMSDPEYVSQTVAPAPPVTSQTDLDEQLARRLMLEEEQEQRAARQQWAPSPRDGRVPHGSPTLQESERGSKDTMAEFQEQFTKIAESGKKTFGSLISKVKSKMSEFDQSRTSGSGAGSQGTEPRWSSAQYEQRTQSHYHDANPSADAAQPRGYDVSSPVATSSPKYATYSPRTPAKPSTAEPANTSTSRSSSPLPPVSTEAAIPAQASPGQPSNIDPGKLGLLPKRPVSLLASQAPPERKASEDEELEYTENPFEEGNN